ncbi:DUF3291 domain-containing protein [Nocardiopsis alkaliphila]|uniref:DUF3291 domain-containing protein n=1 Tax=Nocardiopsis alkaliphila TaxID=225762 RepID=UPI00034CE5BD|nr:DUF3291 domain-containing protein [Nocardiopsis alkaliphila]
MSTLLRPHSAPDHSANRPRPARPSRSGALGSARGAAPVLAEYRVIQGEPTHLKALVRALREQAEDHIGHQAEVHFLDEGDRIHLVHLWQGPLDLRGFVERTHGDLLAYRHAAGAFPLVERTLWWSTSGARITLEEAAERAAHLSAHGPGSRAFTLASPVPLPA